MRNRDRRAQKKPDRGGKTSVRATFGDERRLALRGKRHSAYLAAFGAAGFCVFGSALGAAFGAGGVIGAASAGAAAAAAQPQVGSAAAQVASQQPLLQPFEQHDFLQQRLRQRFLQQRTFLPQHFAASQQLFTQQLAFAQHFLPHERNRENRPPQRDLPQQVFGQQAFGQHDFAQRFSNDCRPQHFVRQLFCLPQQAASAVAPPVPTKHNAARVQRIERMVRKLPQETGKNRRLEP